jgi:hypothetical protein
MMSYAGDVRLGVATDASVVGDPAPIVSAYDDELAALIE